VAECGHTSKPLQVGGSLGTTHISVVPA
jgi:hypothetical protein